MITYAQIEAIHEAMRELEAAENKQCILGAPYEVFESADVHACLAKIRTSLANPGVQSQSAVESFTLDVILRVVRKALDERGPVYDCDDDDFINDLRWRLLRDEAQ